MNRIFPWIRACCLLLLALAAARGNAEVTRVDVKSREDVLSGRPFGAIGPYEWIAGRAYFTLDPLNPRNDWITDLKLAPRDNHGLVEFSAELVVLRPKDSAKSNGVVLFDVVNRGRFEILQFLNQASGLSRGAESYFGDGLLMKQGFTIVWLGWEQDLPASPDLLHLSGPVVDGIKGQVYGDFAVPMRVNDVSLGDRGAIPYPVADLHATENGLTVSSSRDAAERAVPKEQWAFAAMRDGKLVDDPTRIYLKGGFEPGAVYRFVYVATNPAVAGLGFAGVRDLIAWIRHDPAAIIHANRAYAFGISQSGRFLREFLHEGFNADLAERPVFDAMMIHIGGGSSRGFNERFSQPSRAGLSRVFPFTDNEQTDETTGIHDGLLTEARRVGVVPKIIYTSSSWEYWGSIASAIHTTLDGTADIEVPATSRVYFLAGTQHVPPAFPPRYPAASTDVMAAIPEKGQLKLNPLNYRPALRALFVALDQWVRLGTPPPPSRVPHIDDGTLVPRAKLNMRGFSTINVPSAPQPYRRLDAGERTAGVPTVIPPRAGKPYAALVPQVDDDGNERAGIHLPDLAVPLATHTGWSLRDPSIGSPIDLVQLNGSMDHMIRSRVAAPSGSAQAILVAQLRSVILQSSITSG